ncbi:MAG: MotA/TolQ/ExbB proton channel family protein [Brevinematales bacterium]|nr:MotA/TolQ/ExbB proton channel family protein [Brevinematales bacterium]
MIFSYFQQGGPVMYLILLASIVGLAVFIERWFYLEKVKQNARMINERMKEKLKGLRLDEAIAVCENHPGAASNIIKAGLEVASKSREEIEKAMEDAAKFEIPKLQKNLPVLGTIVSISTLLGLLGTVLGMIISSSVLATKGMSDPAKLIGGIAQALITTAYGLIVAIPAVVAYNYLNAKIENIVNEIEVSTIELIKLLKKDVDTFKKW